MSARALECAAVRAAFWDAYADQLEAQGGDHDQIVRLRGMAGGARYVISDEKHDTDPQDMREADRKHLTGEAK